MIGRARSPKPTVKSGYPKKIRSRSVSHAHGTKQFKRNYLDTKDWNNQAPNPTLRQHVIDGTAVKYAETLKRLAGVTLA